MSAQAPAQETVKVITKDSNGIVKATNEVNESAVQSIVVSVDDILFQTCKIHYANSFNNRLNDIQILKDYGFLFQSAKKSVNNNNKAFGKWRERHFPQLTMKFVSYAINLIVHETDVDEWISKTDCEVSNRSYNNPETVYRAFTRYKKQLADKALQEKEVEKDAIEETGKIIAGIGTDKDIDKEPGKTIGKTPIKTGIQIEPKPLTAEEMYVSGMRAMNMILTRVNEAKWDIEERENILKVAWAIIEGIEKSFEKTETPIEKIAEKAKSKKK